MHEIGKNLGTLRAFFAKTAIPYLSSPLDVDTRTCIARTDFHVSHDSLPDKLAKAARKEPWVMGDLQPGTEWLAATFLGQDEFRLDPAEMSAFLGAADSVAREAYSRMEMSSQGHAWARHTKHEIETILAETKWAAGANILDFGCGTGRHAVELATRGFHVTGVELLEERVEGCKADAHASGLQGLASFAVGDGRFVTLSEQFDGAICLYDVIGSHADNLDNQQLLNNLAKHVRTGGYVVLSVMNWRRTLRLAKHKANVAEDPRALLNLKPSSTMQDTGNVFHPDYYLCDPSTKLVYRREQFEGGNGLPRELVVRDRRYTMPEIREMVEAAGLTVDVVRPVKAGAWNVALSTDDAKELLVVARKR